MHDSASTCAEYLETGQSIHFPFDGYRPTPHGGKHCILDALGLHPAPTSHCIHPCARDVEENFPSGHFRHIVPCKLYLPGLQSKHLLLLPVPLCLALPAPQLLNTTLGVDITEGAAVGAPVGTTVVVAIAPPLPLQSITHFLTQPATSNFLIASAKSVHCWTHATRDLHAAWSIVG